MENVMDKLVSLAKRRGFVFPSSEIYGGINACWDYGPLGVRLKNNVKAAWWKAMTQMRDDVEGLDAAILMHPRVWEASGHIEHFTDPLVDCRQSKKRYRADKLLCVSVKAERNGQVRDVAVLAISEGNLSDEGFLRKASRLIKKTGGGEMVPVDPASAVSFMELQKESRAHVIAPEADEPGTLTDPRLFNLMFKTFMGPVEEAAAVIFLRPETAQGIYVNFDNVRISSRQKVPFGIAQIGKAFRNEITPGNFIFRTREFEQMEMQFFVKPEDDVRWFDHWKEARMQWYLDNGIRKEKLRFHEHQKGELAHYAKRAFDIDYEYPFGWHELEGIHNRSDFDLSRHQEYSGKKMEYFDEETKERYLPYIIETSAGCDRTMLTVMVDAYREDEQDGSPRVFLSLHPRLAPIKAGIFPLVKRDGMPELAHRIEAELRPHMEVFYDEKAAVGRRYRRMDEVGTPFCVTVDSESLQNESVTVRHRDSLEQERVNLADLKGYLLGRM